MLKLGPTWGVGAYKLFETGQLLSLQSWQVVQPGAAASLTSRALRVFEAVFTRLI